MTSADDKWTSPSCAESVEVDLAVDCGLPLLKASVDEVATGAIIDVVVKYAFKRCQELCNGCGGESKVRCNTKSKLGL